MKKTVTIEKFVVLVIVVIIAFAIGAHSGRIAGRNEVTLTAGEMRILALPENTREAIISALNEPAGKGTFTMKDISKNEVTKIAIEALTNSGGKIVDSNPDFTISGRVESGSRENLVIKIVDTNTGKVIFNNDNGWTDDNLDEDSLQEKCYTLGNEFAASSYKKQKVASIIVKATTSQTPALIITKTQPNKPQ